MYNGVDMYAHCSRLLLNVCLTNDQTLNTQSGQPT